MKDLLMILAAWLSCVLAVRMLDELEVSQALAKIDEELEALSEA